MGEIILNWIRLLILLLCFQCVSLPKFIPPSSHKDETILVDGVLRKFLYFAPERKDNANKLSLTLVLHGGGGNPEGMVYLTRFSDRALEEETIFVYPQGIGNRWNDGRNVSHSETDIKNTNDVRFLRELVLWFQTQFEIDPNRIHVVGLSNGGFMAQRLACEDANLYATFSSVAATLSTNLSKSCKKPESKIALNLIFGKEDTVVPFNGGFVLLPGKEPSSKIPAGEVLSFPASIQFWKQSLECQKSTVTYLPDLKGKNPQTTERRDEQICTNGSFLQSNLIFKGQHIWPHGFYYKSASEYGYLSNDYDTSKEILKFQKENPKSGANLAHRFLKQH